MAVNAVGAMVCAALLAEVVLDHRTPWLGIAGVALMFAGIVVPFHREFMAIHKGFQHVERDAMSGIRHRRGEHDRVELIGSTHTAHPFRKVHDQPLVAIFLTLVAWGLVIAEGAVWALNRF